VKSFLDTGNLSRHDVLPYPSRLAQPFTHGSFVRLTGFPFVWALVQKSKAATGPWISFRSETSSEEMASHFMAMQKASLRHLLILMKWPPASPSINSRHKFLVLCLQDWTTPDLMKWRKYYGMILVATTVFTTRLLRSVEDYQFEILGQSTAGLTSRGTR
jgi:hypothetical protein